jgi:hypothetical protein
MMTQFARKTTAIVAAFALSAVMFAPAVASAQGPGAPARAVTLPVVGTVATGGTFNGAVNITRFVNQNGQVMAEGLLTGILTNATGTATTVVSTFATPVNITQATCSILHLDLGPLSLNLLGLQVNLSEIVLDITGQTGAGNLLGNLLCGIAGLLDSPGGLARLLNQLLGILG